MQQDWAVIKTTTLTERVYDALRARVIAGDWASGQFLREKEISEKLGVSRTPVREALGRLAADGFLERIPHRGFKIPEHSAKELLDLYPILSALEVLAAKDGFKEIDKERLGSLRSINESYRAAYALQDAKEGVRLNNQFHNLLTLDCANPKLSQMIRGLQAEVFRLECWALVNIYSWDVSIREHEELLDAIESSDYDKALEILTRNRSMTVEELPNFTKEHLN